MINIFKALNPLNILRLLLVLLALRGVYWYYVPEKLEFAFSGVFSRLLLPYSTHYPFPSSVNIILAAAIVFIQALLLNYLVNNYNLLGKPTLLPALMYVTVSAIFMPFLVLSPALICNFLILAALFRLLNLYKTKDAISTTYDLGLIVALGAIIYIPFIYFFLIIWIGLIIFRPVIWREFLAPVIGFLTVFFFLAVYYYLNNQLGQFYEIWKPLATQLNGRIGINFYNYLILIPIVLILLLCIVKIQQNFFRSYVQIRKSFQLIFVLFLLSLFSVYVRAAFNLNHFILSAISVSVFFSYYFLNAKQKWFYETLYFVLIISIIYFQFNTF